MDVRPCWARNDTLWLLQQLVILFMNLLRRCPRKQAVVRMLCMLGCMHGQSSIYTSLVQQTTVTSKKNWRIPCNEGCARNDICEVGVSISQATMEIGLSVPKNKSGSWSAARSGLNCKVSERIENNQKAECSRWISTSSPLCTAIGEALVLVWGNRLKSIKIRPFGNALDGLDSGASSFRCAESLDAISGLKLLLSPVTTPSSRSIPASSRFANVSKNVSSSGRLNYNPNDHLDFSRNLSLLDVSDRESDIEGMGDSEEPRSPLFDPSILAKFERAIEASSDDNWQTSEVCTSSSRIACSSTDVCSDADSPNWSEELAIASDAYGISHHVNEAAQSPLGDIMSSIRTPAVKYAHKDKDYLEDFELKCGVWFVPCSTCNGSCKMIFADEISQ